jgi:hypothetical protein
LTPRLTESLSAAHQKASKADFQAWLINQETHFKQMQIWEDVLQNPQRIFTADETRINVHTVPNKDIAPKGEKCVQLCLKSQIKQGPSVAICENVAGQLAPSMFIF